MKPILFNNDETDLICDLLADRHDNLKDRLESEEECKLNGHQDTGRGDCANCDQFLPVEDNSDTANEFNLIERIQNKLFSGVHTIHTDADIVMHTGENYLDSLTVECIRLNNVDYQTTGTGGNCTALTTQVDNFTIMITNECQIPNSLESEVVIGIYDNESCEGDSLNNNTVVKFKDINLELLTKLVKEPQSVLFRVEWIEGYGTTDPRTVSIDELTFDDINHESNQWNMDAYYGDNWISTFINIPVGNSSDCYADGHVKFTRIN